MAHEVYRTETTPINRRPGEARITVYVSIGQAF